MKKSLIITFFLVYSSFAFSSDSRVGVKGLYLGQDGDEACSLIKSNFSENGDFIDKAANEAYNHFGLELASRVCFIEMSYYSSFALVSMDSKNKVKEINASYKAFGVLDMSLEDFAQIFVDNYDWVNSLNYEANEYFPESPGTYVFNDVDGLGFELTIYDSSIKIKKTPPKQPKPINKPSFN